MEFVFGLNSFTRPILQDLWFLLVLIYYSVAMNIVLISQ